MIGQNTEKSSCAIGWWCPDLVERGCVEDQPQHFRRAAADAARTAALREFQIRTLPIGFVVAQFGCEATDEPQKFSRRVQFLLMRRFRQRAAHRYLGEARIGVHDFGDRQASGERLQNERHGNARATHTRASAQMLRVGDNPLLHANQFNRFDRMLKLGKSN